MVKVTTTKDGVRFAVHAKPRARTSEVRGVREGALDVSLAAPPVDGAANEELIRLLATRLGIAKSRIVILRGEGARTKLVEVLGATPAEITGLAGTK
jgi:uncharacterized protein (TIGR00251 family)